MNEINPTPKVALVTGAAHRVGRAVALGLARAGYDLAITYRRSMEAAAEVVHELETLGRRALAIEVDLSRPDAAGVVQKCFRQQFSRLDALINNASTFAPGPLGDLTPESFDQCMAINARAPLLLIRQFAPMLSHGADISRSHTLGRVVNFIDIHVLGQPLPGYLAYNASKAALHEITMTLSQELAPLITVNAIAPGVVAWADRYTEQDRKTYLKRVPLQRAGTPEDAATGVLFLVRDAHYCTGQIIKVDGGRLLT